jgi:hypothetical protein
MEVVRVTYAPTGTADITDVAGVGCFKRNIVSEFTPADGYFHTIANNVLFCSSAIIRTTFFGTEKNLSVKTHWDNFSHVLNRSTSYSWARFGIESGSGARLVPNLSLTLVRLLLRLVWVLSQSESSPVSLKTKRKDRRHPKNLAPFRPPLPLLPSNGLSTVLGRSLRGGWELSTYIHKFPDDASRKTDTNQWILAGCHDQRDAWLCPVQV